MGKSSERNEHVWVMPKRVLCSIQNQHLLVWLNCESNVWNLSIHADIWIISGVNKKTNHTGKPSIWNITTQYYLGIFVSETRSESAYVTQPTSTRWYTLYPHQPVTNYYYIYYILCFIVEHTRRNY